MILDTDIIIKTCEAIAAISTACIIISKVVKRTVIKYSNSNKVDESIKEIKKELDNYIIKANATDEKLKLGIMSLARDRINQAHKYYTELGKIDRSSLESIESLYNSYKELGGNGFVSDLIKDIRNLKVM